MDREEDDADICNEIGGYWNTPIPSPERQSPMTRETKLEPCPFCGGKVDLETTIDGRKWWGVVCRNSKNVGGTCGISIRATASKEAAIKRWNTRAPKPVEGRDVTEGKVLALIEQMQARYSSSSVENEALTLISETFVASQQSIQGQLDAAREALRYFAGCQYPVCTTINQIGREWRLDMLNEAFAKAEVALAAIDQPEGERS